MGDASVDSVAASVMVGGEPAKADWRELVAAKQTALKRELPSEWLLSPDLLASLSVHSSAGVRLIEADVPRQSGLLSETELEITENYSAGQLIQELATGTLSSLAVTTAFCKRAAIAQQLTSCLTEYFFSRALVRAKYLDDHLKTTGKPVGPLHGLPISIKDSFCVEGVQSTVGYVSFLKNPPETSNSALVNMLLNLGAVLYAKTNIPQTMMTGDSENNIFGRTLNPHNTSLTAGGSSGGEGALVALRGSVLGVGTDIAGSIRIPALCNGVYGFKPTVARIPFGGQVSGAVESLPGLQPAAGPLAHSVDDIELFMSTILQAEPWRYDSTAIGAPWNKHQPAQSKLNIGILPEDPSFPLHPPVRRALDRAIDALQSHGHTIVRFDGEDSSLTSTLDIAYGNRLAFQYFIYGPHTDNITPSGEPLVASVAKFSSPMFSGPFPVDQSLDLIDKIDALHQARHEYTEAWRKCWVDTGIDVILGPAAQNTATPHDTYGWPPYTVLWNLLDYPACIIPYGVSSKTEDPEPFILRDGVQPSYDPEATDGAPCAIQVIAPRFQDERCLAAAKIIDIDIRSLAVGSTELVEKGPRLVAVCFQTEQRDLEGELQLNAM